MKWTVRKTIETCVTVSFLMLLVLIASYFSYLMYMQRSFDKEKTIHFLTSISEGQLPYFTTEMNDHNLQVLQSRSEILKATYRTQDLELYLFDQKGKPLLSSTISEKNLQNLTVLNIFESEGKIFLKREITVGEDLLGYLILSASRSSLSSIFLEESLVWVFVVIIAVMAGMLLFLRYLLRRLMLVPLRSLLGRVMLIDGFIGSSDGSSPFEKVESKIEEFDQINLALLKLSLNLKDSLRDRIMFEKESTASRTLAETSKQVAHDIRSPLSALSMVTSTLKDLPEEKRLLIRNSVQRINDIANDLLQKGTPDKVATNSGNFEKKQAVNVNKLSLEFIPVIVDMLVSEKRMQFREHAGIDIDVDLSDSFGAFSNVDSGELKRVISNLVNNAVEAFNESKGRVVVGVTKGNSKVEIFVRDNGKGIPEHVLKKLGELGVTNGKDGTSSGSGLGVYHAKKTIESFGGKFKIDSEVGQGTTMRMILPMADTPAWFADKIDLTGKSMLVSLDDDISIHQIWAGRLSSLGALQINHLKIQSGDVFHKYVSENINLLRSTLFLVDFELLNQTRTGLDLIEGLGLEKYAILVTSRYEEKDIQTRAARIGLKLLPKSLAGFVPFEVGLPKSKFDFVLVDDDPLVRMTWEMAAKDQGKALVCFSSGEAIKSVIKDISSESRFFIDSNLGKDEKGEDLAKELFDLGYHNLYLATGYEPDQFAHVTWVKGIVGKDLPS